MGFPVGLLLLQGLLFGLFLGLFLGLDGGLDARFPFSEFFLIGQQEVLRGILLPLDLL